MTAASIAKVNGMQAVRRATGAAILVWGAWAALQYGVAWYAALSPTLAAALAGGLLAALASALGTVPVALSKTVSRRATDLMLGFGAGVMLAASVFSLIIPALAQSRTQGAGAWTAGALVSVGILLGAALLLALGKAFSQSPHQVPGVDAMATDRRRAWLFVAAITLHNLPEGAAIGVAFAGLSHSAAVGLATGIGIQDIPEGLAVALALRAAGYDRGQSVLVGMASGLVEPVFAVLGAALVTSFTPLLPWGLAIAAGAMLYVIANEVIPEMHRRGQRTHASLALMIGFVMMLVLDTALA